MPDCSLFSHGWLPSQLTVPAEQALNVLRQSEVRVLSPAVLVTEFSSLLRKLMARRQVERALADRLLRDLLSFRIELVPTDEQLLLRAWDIATDLGQSDTFDALGYATAEAYGAEFWTCDRRLANAAAGRDYPRLRFIP